MAELPENVKKLFETAIPFTARAGIRALEFDRSNIKLKMPLKPNINHAGNMYAGALFTLAEMTGGAVALIYFNDKPYVPILIELRIKFVKHARGDIFVEYSLTEEEVAAIIDECEERDEADFDIELELTDEHGEVVCVTQGSYQLRKNR